VLASITSASTLFGVTSNNELVSFDTSSPSSFQTSVTITGLANINDSILNLSFNPQVGSFYGIDNSANFYQISFAGVATQITTTFAPTGFSAGFAYDPFSGDFVYAGDNAENFSLTIGGAATTNPNFTFAGAGTPSIFGLGIDPAFSTAYALDSNTNSLYFSADPLFPTGSELSLIGGLGFDVTGFGGLTVDEDGNLFASLSTDGLTSSLYSIDPNTGVATSVGTFGGAGISSLTSIPEPSAVLLGLLSIMPFLRRRRA
jgi:Domain of unknown function (DUF4394)